MVKPVFSLEIGNSVYGSESKTIGIVRSDIEFEGVDRLRVGAVAEQQQQAERP